MIYNVMYGCFSLLQGMPEEMSFNKILSPHALNSIFAWA